ncbi:MAG: hypothetical protein H3C58_12145, partial [Fimbriimonadaceae bacterium]|nr:hypothetical protein [Fimbriimonadaceae bacterium]
MSRDALDDRITEVSEALFLLKVPIRSVPQDVKHEIADSLVDNRDYLEQVRWALIARGYLPKPEK